MTYVLAAQRRGSIEEMRAHFERYREYLDRHRDAFPPGAWALATASWYFDPQDHRCPHDAWLREVVVSEPGRGERDDRRSTTIVTRLLGAHHDGEIELHYRNVARYQFSMTDVTGGHRDWRYDEYRLSEAGRVLHEIEWSGLRETGRWIIEAEDVEYRWISQAASP